MKGRRDGRTPNQDRRSKRLLRRVYFLFRDLRGADGATSTDESTLTASVARGKHIWEKNSCINCHTLLGEGAYFAPELGNVWKRWGGEEDPEGARETMKAWMQAQPTGIEGRRQMPQFNLSEQELNDLADFLEWTSRIKTQDWPPNEAG